MSATRKIPVDHSEELRPYFDAVCDKENWKRAIKANVRGTDLAKTVRAIQWFAGSKTTINFIGRNLFEVTAPGYYADVGA